MIAGAGARSEGALFATPSIPKRARSRTQGLRKVAISARTSSRRGPCSAIRLISVNSVTGFDTFSLSFDAKLGWRRL